MADLWKRLRLLSSLSESQSGLPEYVHLNDLAAEKCGGKILFATDDWFAVAENLLKAESPVWKEGVYTECGKWMDGWETRRKRKCGHDWCIIKLGVPGIIHGFEINTSFFTGNYAPNISIQAVEINDDNIYDWPERISEMGTEASEEDLIKINEVPSEKWETIVSMSKLKPGFVDSCHNYFALNVHQRFTHLRLNMFPDGGIARFRVYGQAAPDWSVFYSNAEKALDLLAMINGSICIGYSNIHFGHARNITRPGRGKCMSDGWETARRLDRPPIFKEDSNGVLLTKGFEWAAFSLGHAGKAKMIEIDTNHFKGNYPDSVKIQGCFLNDLEKEADLIKSFEDSTWKEILPQQKLSSHKRHFFREINDVGVISHIRVIMYPDGGISRIRVFGNLVIESDVCN